MYRVLKRFDEMPWVDIAPGARVKRFTDENQTIRLVQFSSPFQEIELCTRGHVGFVVRGEFAIEFTDMKLEFHQGDALSIPAGAATAHRAIITSEVTLFLVEPA